MILDSYIITVVDYVGLCTPFIVVRMIYICIYGLWEYWIVDYENGSLWFSMLIEINVKWDMVVSCDWYICGY